MFGRSLGVILAASLLATPALAADEIDLDQPHVATTRDQTIIGGTDVPSGKWPDTVAVLGADGACTGTLIAPDVVLTAGHCADMNPTQVIANTTNYSGSGGARASVARTVAHPNWETTYDVALVMLAQPINSVTPRKLGTTCTFDAFGADTMVRLVGFGSTEIDGMGDNTLLKEAMAAVTDPMCSSGNGCNTTVAPGGEFIAGGTGTADSCFGDSGGPVYLETPRGAIVIGAVSRGVNNAATACGGGGIYVRTDKIAQWIEQTAGKAVAQDTCAAGPDGSGSGSGGTGSGGGGEGGEGDNAYGEVVIGGCSVAGTGSGSLSLVLFALALAVARRRRGSNAKPADDQPFSIPPWRIS